MPLLAWSAFFFALLGSASADNADETWSIPDVHLLQTELSLQAALDQGNPFDSLFHRNSGNSLVNKCLRQDNTNHFDYKAATFTYPGSHDGPNPQKRYQFDNGPWLGMYNPSIVKLPPSLRRQAGSKSAMFAMTLRTDGHQCEHLGHKPSGSYMPPRGASPTQFLLLGHDYCVNSMMPLILGNRSFSAAQDVRLFVHEDKLYVSFVSISRISTKSGFQNEGLWLARVNVDFGSSVASMDFHKAVRIGGFEEKNYGLFGNGQKIMAMTWVDETSRHIDFVDSYLSMDKKREVWHNGANLLQLQDGSGDLLGLRHVHYDGRGAFQYGSEYFQQFFRISGKAPHVLKAVGRKFCMKSRTGLCEAVQVSMSIMQTETDTILLSYGINDCESRFNTFSLSSILQQMTPIPSDDPAFEAPVIEVQTHEDDYDREGTLLMRGRPSPKYYPIFASQHKIDTDFATCMSRAISKALDCKQLGASKSQSSVLMDWWQTESEHQGQSQCFASIGHWSGELPDADHLPNQVLGARALHFVRDPFDMCVHSYYYYKTRSRDKWANNPLKDVCRWSSELRSVCDKLNSGAILVSQEDWPDHSYRELLKTLPFDEGALLEFEHCMGDINAMSEAAVASLKNPAIKTVCLGGPPKSSLFHLNFWLSTLDFFDFGQLPGERYANIRNAIMETDPTNDLDCECCEGYDISRNIDQNKKGELAEAFASIDSSRFNGKGMALRKLLGCGSSFEVKDLDSA